MPCSDKEQVNTYSKVLFKISKFLQQCKLFYNKSAHYYDDICKKDGTNPVNHTLGRQSNIYLHSVSCLALASTLIGITF